MTAIRRRRLIPPRNAELTFKFETAPAEVPKFENLCIFDKKVYQLISTNGKQTQIKDFSNSIKTFVPTKHVHIAKGALSKLYEFLLIRKWYVEKQAHSSKSDVLFELNLYLQQVEKQLFKKFIK